MKLPVATTSVALAALVVACLPASVQNTLSWQPSWNETGAWWQLATGHLVHWTTSHLAWDVLALLALGWWCEHRQPWQSRLTLLAAALGVALMLPLSDPQLTSYRGLSGLAAALVGLAAACSWRQTDHLERWMFSTLLIGLLAKSAWEMHTGTCLFADTDGVRPVPSAHLCGAGIGYTVGILPWAGRRTLTIDKPARDISSRLKRMPS